MSCKSCPEGSLRAAVRRQVSTNFFPTGECIYLLFPHYCHFCIPSSCEQICSGQDAENNLDCKIKYGWLCSSTMKVNDSPLQSFSRRCSSLVSPGTDRNLDKSQIILPSIKKTRVKSSRELPPCDLNKSYAGFSLCHLAWHVSCGSAVTWRILSACVVKEFLSFLSGIQKI